MSVAERLKEERARVGFTQQRLADAVGIRKLTQLNYEAGRTAPDTNYLLAIEGVGMDAVYVLAGERRANATHEPTATYLRPVDRGAVRAAVKALTGWLQENELQLTPEQAAEAVLTLCDLAAEPAQIEEQAPKALRMLRLVA